MILRSVAPRYFVPESLCRPSTVDWHEPPFLLFRRLWTCKFRDPGAGSPPEGMKKLDQILGRLYRLYGKSDAFRSVNYPRTDHVYNDEKQKMVEWFIRYLAGGHS
jgi:hypothetical protein